MNIEPWFILALSGTFLYACVTFIDKFIVEKIYDDFRGIVGFSSLIAVFVGVLVLFTLRLDAISLEDMALLMTSGICIVMSTYLYFSVISKDHVTYVTVFFQMIPIVVIVLAYILLRESLLPIQLLGAVVVILGGVAIFFADHTSVGFRWKMSASSIVIMLLYDLLWALAAICIKLASPSVQLGHVVIYESLGMGVAGLVITLSIPAIRKAFFALLLRSPRYGLIALIGNEGIMYLTAKLSMNFAYRLGPAGLVSVVESSQIMIAMIMGYILSTLWPHIFKENTNRTTVIHKSIYALFMIFGLFLIQ